MIACPNSRHVSGGHRIGKGSPGHSHQVSPTKGTGSRPAALLLCGGLRCKRALVRMVVKELPFETLNELAMLGEQVALGLAD